MEEASSESELWNYQRCLSSCKKAGKANNKTVNKINENKAGVNGEKQMKLRRTDSRHFHITNKSFVDFHSHMKRLCKPAAWL